MRGGLEGGGVFEGWFGGGKRRKLEKHFPVNFQKKKYLKKKYFIFKNK